MNIHAISTILLAGSILAAAPLTAQQPAEDRIPAKGLAVSSGNGHFHTLDFTRHAVGPHDILIEILYSGICHSDIHHVREDWGKETFPMVPGHEIVGRVIQVGRDVTTFKPGDYAGVGCMIDSCGACAECSDHFEQYCKDLVLTYHDRDPKHGNEVTQGGYSNCIVLPAAFAIHVPAGADLKRVAPLLCAGITTFAPLNYAGVKAGDQVGVAGYGGLGHMAVQYAVARGAEVTVFDITDEKRADALRMGAKRYVNVNNPTELDGLNNSFDFIISTIPARYEPAMYLRMLKRNGQLCIVGLPSNADMPTLTLSDLVMQGNRRVFGSQIGGIKETQEMLDYSVAKGIYPEVELISATPEAVENAYRQVLDGKVKFRYVIDMKTLH